MRQAYLLRVEIDTTIPVPDEVVEAVVENSTARDAIDDGIWGWFPEELTDEDMLDLSLVYLGPTTHPTDVLQSGYDYEQDCEVDDDA